MQSSSAANAYAQSARSVGTPRSIEYQAFQRVTAMLQAASEPDTPFYKLAEAVHLNAKLWIRLAADLLSEQNALPEDLRGNLLSLAEFSRRHSLKVLESRTGADDLIAINTAIMKGLRGIALSDAEAEAAAAAPAPQAVAAGG